MTQSSLSPKQQQQLYSEFNGYNHETLAAKYRISTAQVYREIGIHYRLIERETFNHAITSVSTNPELYQHLPKPLRKLIVAEAHRLEATEALEILGRLNTH